MGRWDALVVLAGLAAGVVLCIFHETAIGASAITGAFAYAGRHGVSTIQARFSGPPPS